jgi:hypothetical protein
MNLPPPPPKLARIFLKIFVIKSDMRVYTLTLTLFFGFLNLLPKSGRSQKLSDQSVISIIACASDASNLITSFGHCALHIYDPVQGLNNVYHYGVLNLNDKSLLSDFLLGRAESQFEAVKYPLFKLGMPISTELFGRHH